MKDEVLKDLKSKMEKTIEVFKHDLARMRTGRASVSLFDGIKVDYYGSMLPLNQVASLTVPEPRLITIQPWDTNALANIERAILKSELGLTPANDGKIIRIAIPPLTEERRKEIVKLVKKITEEYRVILRNIRRDANEELKDLKKEKVISEDESFAVQEEVQKITDNYIKKAEQLYAEKEKEILAF
ncbi:MAG: ribosome recycling factor [Deltaproteobacteria bacterium]|nr:ribosome recycling factor [Deltaproteobacteria bacterium]TSA07969.1 MAG: ribosome recycling factor [Deltaproteobacteria bacterium]